MFRYFSESTDPHLFYCRETGSGGIRGFDERDPNGAEVGPAGTFGIQPDFVRHLDLLREACNRPLTVTSGYRHPTHSVEAKKNEPGRHTMGDAADIAVVGGFERGQIVAEAIRLGFKGIGVARTFVHVDRRSGRLTMWTY